MCYCTSIMSSVYICLHSEISYAVLAGRRGEGNHSPGRHFSRSGIRDSTFQRFTRQYVLVARVFKAGIQMLGCIY